MRFNGIHKKSPPCLQVNGNASTEQAWTPTKKPAQILQMKSHVTSSTSKGSSANLKDKQHEEPRSQQIPESTTFNTSSTWKNSTILLGQTDHAKFAKHPSRRLGERKSCIHTNIHPKKNQIQRTEAR